MNTDTPISRASTLARKPGLVEAEIDGSTVVLDINGDKCCGFDPIGSQIWKMLETPALVQSICERLVSSYEVDAATCERDVLDLLQDMRDQNLIELVAALPATA